MAELPEIGTPMYLVQSADTNFRSRLEAVADGTLSVTAPLETTGPDAPRPGQQIEVFWTQPRARVVLPCRLVGIAGSAPYRWTLEPLAAPKSSNRREYVRGGGGPAVQLVPETDEEAADDEAVLNGRLLDISEGGLRCWVPGSSGIKVGDKMAASLRLETGDLEVEGTVYTVRDAVGEEGRHLVVRFESDDTTASLIRRHVFACERAERRRGLDVLSA